MPKSTTDKKKKVMSVSLNLRQIGEMIIRSEGIHEGLYNVTFEFQIGVGGVGPTPETLVPGATIGVTGVGIAYTEVAGPLTLDASVINPK